MAISLYLPKDINEVIKKVIETGSTVSPNYISTTVGSPSILKRNLIKAGDTENLDYDFNIVPLALPSTHSTGNVAKARSFDYDFIVVNSDPLNEQPVFVTDTGSYSFKVKFLSKVVEDMQEYNPETEEIETIPYHRYTYSILEQSISTSQEDLRSATAFKATSLDNTEEKTIGMVTGDIKVKVLKAFDLPLDQTDIRYDFIKQELTLSCYATMTSELDSLYKRTKMLLSPGSVSEYSHLRLAGSVTYQPSLETFYPNKTVSNDIPNLRDYLDTNNATSYLGYIVILKPFEGLLFNLETGTTSTTVYDPNRIPSIFQISNLRVYNDISELYAGQSSVVSTVGSITKVELYTSAIDAVAAPTVDTSFEGGSPKEWYDFFKEYGIFCRVYKEGEDVKRIYFNRVDNKITEDLVEIRVTSTAPVSLTTTPDYPNLIFSDLPGKNSDKNSITTMSTETTDGTNYYLTHFLNSTTEPKALTSNITYIGTKKIKAIQVRIDTADSLVYNDYKSTTNLFEYVCEKTESLESYGFEELLQTLATYIRTTFLYEVVVEADKGILHINNTGTLSSNLYIEFKYSDSTTLPIEYTGDTGLPPFNLVLDKYQSITNQKESIVRLDSLSTDVLQPIVNDCSYIILNNQNLLDLTLHIQPFAYRVLDSKVDEQTTIFSDITVTTIDLHKQLLDSVAPYFTSIIPLYNSSHVFLNRYAVQLDSIKIDEKVMKNILIWSDKNKKGLSAGYLTTYQGLMEYVEGSPVYVEIEPVLNSSIAFEGDYVSLNTSYGIVDNYGKSSTISVDMLAGSFEVSTATVKGITETCVFTVTPTTTLEDIVAQSTLTSLDLTVQDTNLLLKVSSTSEDRLRVSVNNIDSLIKIVSCKLPCISEDSITFMLNKEV